MEKTFRALEAQDEADENIFVLGWLYKLDIEFVEALHRKEPFALIIMAFYTVLLGALEEENWWVRGWADHILKVIKMTLPEDCVVWLAWPIEEAAILVRSKFIRSQSINIPHHTKHLRADHMHITQ